MFTMRMEVVQARLLFECHAIPQSAITFENESIIARCHLMEDYHLIDFLQSIRSGLNGVFIPLLQPFVSLSKQ